MEGPALLVLSGAEGRHAARVNGVYHRQRGGGEAAGGGGAARFAEYAKEESPWLVLRYAETSTCAGFELHDEGEVLAKAQGGAGAARFPEPAWLEGLAFFVHESSSRFRHAPGVRLRAHARRACLAPHSMPAARGLNLLPARGGFAMGPGEGPWALLGKNAEGGRAKFVAAQAERLADAANADFCFERSGQRLHDLRDQTRFAAQKFNGCAVRGWVMPVQVAAETSAEQVKR